ncbi:hypothetical protein T492DRAFT_568388, partial [Pavlovales sp. CCMP2436]
IQKLELVGMGLEDISEVACCHALEKLSVDNNQLASFTGVEELPELRTLSAQNNVLTSLDGLRSLPKLSIINLRLSHNKLATLPQSLAACARLTVLDVGSNQLKSVDQLGALTGLERLKNLTLHGNPLCTAL